MTAEEEESHGNDDATTTSASTSTSMSIAPLKAKKNVFIRSDEYAWLPARILEQTEEEAVVQVFELGEDGTIQISADSKNVVVPLNEYPPQNALPMKNVNQYGDMIDLPFLHEPGILYNLRTRFFQDQPYTRTGDILIATNPYQWLSHIYTTELRQRYLPQNIYDPASGMVKKSIEPHVYEISAMAFRGLAVDRQNQSILISGESGAGKTETVKICLDQIATIQEGGGRTMNLKGRQILSGEGGQHKVMSSIVQRVVDSNPLLEAFGNAKTLRNDNSSRFGKFVQLQFDQSSNTNPNDDDDDDDGSDTNQNYNCNLVGSHIEVYLLEKSRVVTHAPGERNFHIFYQMLGASDDIKRKIDADVLLGKTPASFPYLGNRDDLGMKTKRRSSIALSLSNHKSSHSTGGRGGEDHDEDDASHNTNATLIDGTSDAQWFEETIKELEIIGIKDESLWMLMRALCVVLQLGTLKFVEDSQQDGHAMIDQDQTKEGGEFAKLAQLMGIDMDILSQAFTNKTIKAGTTEISSPISPQQAEEGCNAYAKDVYSKIFSYLVGTINAATSASSIHQSKGSTSTTTAAVGGDESSKPPEKHGLIGVLDIFGFEAFEKNQFEQLCINYANERLQNMFASIVFISLMDEYTREGLVVDFSYETNTDVLNLISGKVGILAILNEECIRPGGNDRAFVTKILAANKNSSRMFKNKGFTSHQFGVKHYAGAVVYTAADFISINKDIMPIDLQKVSRLSTNTVIAAGYEEPMGSSGKNTAGRSAQRSKTNLVKNTVASQFRKQLNSLLDTLASTKTRYIRCIKPNGLKQPRLMENNEILRQLQSGGVIAAINIASASYPNKMEHHAVLKRFRNLGDKPDPSQDIQTQVLKMLTIALKDFISPIKGGTPRLPFTIGKSRTYFRTGALEYLENGRNENIGFFAIIIQRNYRMSPFRKSFLVQRSAAVRIQAVMRGFIWKRRVAKMPHCSVVIQSWGRCVLAKQRFKKYKSAVKIQRRWFVARAIIRLEHRNKAATNIQKVARGSIQRPKFRNELTQKTKATVLIQKVARGHIQIVKYRAILAKIRLEQKNAAIQIQRIVRGHNLRLKFRAATRIQRIARGYSQRIKFKKVIEQDKARKTKAALHIQATVRGYSQLVKYRAIKKAEEERVAAEKAAEEARLNAERLAAEKAAEAELIAAERAAEEARLKAERLAEEERIAAERRAEEEQLAAERRAEEERLATQKQAATERLAAEKQVREERLAAEKRAEKERLAAERRAEKERLVAEKQAEKERLVAEKRAEKERIATEKRIAEEAERFAEEERLATEAKAEEERLEAQRVAASLEARLAAAEKRADEERMKAEKLASENAELTNRILKASDEDDAIDKAIKAAQAKAAADNEITEEPDGDEELELAMEMALLAMQNPDLAPQELNTLLGKPTENTASSGRSFFGRMAEGFGRIAKATTAPAPVIEGMPWASPGPTSFLGQFRSGGRSVANYGDRSRGRFSDDMSIADTVVSGVSMMLPDTLTAEELRNRRVKMKLQQDIRKLKNQVSEMNRDLRKLQSRGDKARAGYMEQLSPLVGRHESASIELASVQQKFDLDDIDSDFVISAVEKASIRLGLGSHEDQKSRMSDEEKLQFDAQILQEAQLVRQMRQMYSMGLQRSLHKKHAERDIGYLKSCKKWLSDSTDVKMKMRKLANSLDEMKTVYEEIFWKQEAAFARYDPTMTIRESLDDLF